MSDTEYGHDEAMRDLDAVANGSEHSQTSTRILWETHKRVAAYIATLEAAHREPVRDDAGWRDSDARSAADFLRGYLDTNGTRYARQMLATITTALTAAQSERDDLRDRYVTTSAEAAFEVLIAQRDAEAGKVAVRDEALRLFNVWVQTYFDGFPRAAGSVEGVPAYFIGLAESALAPQPTGDSE